MSSPTGGSSCHLLGFPRQQGALQGRRRGRGWNWAGHRKDNSRHSHPGPIPGHRIPTSRSCRRPSWFWSSSRKRSSWLTCIVPIASSYSSVGRIWLRCSPFIWARWMMSRHSSSLRKPGISARRGGGGGHRLSQATGATGAFLFAVPAGLLCPGTPRVRTSHAALPLLCTLTPELSCPAKAG